MQKKSFYSLSFSFCLFVFSSCSSIEMIRPGQQAQISMEDQALEGEKVFYPELSSTVDIELSFEDIAVLDDQQAEVEEENFSFLDSSLFGEEKNIIVDEHDVEQADLEVAENPLDSQDQSEWIEEREEDSVSNRMAQREQSGRPQTDLPLEYHENLYNFWNNYFTQRDKARFIRHLENGERFRPLIQSIFREYGLPEDLFYVGLIESGFNLHIQSHAAAVGPWQFIKGTATRYGMRVEGQIDERRNIIKATHAAAQYFTDLYNIFGSWELALCAYNAGEYRIINAIRRGKTRSYKELVDKKLIPRETIYYVPKVAAARDISKNRQKYQINVAKQEDSVYLNATIVEVQRNFTLAEVAQFLNLPQESLKTLNPDFRWAQMSATSRRPIRLVVPKKYQQRVAQNFRAGSRTPYTASAASTRTEETTTYRVQRGDHLSGIAQRFGVSVSDIQRENNLRGHRILAGQNLRIPGHQRDDILYTVKRGDSLIAIARRFNVNVNDLRSANNLRGSRILVGQKLSIPNSQVRVYSVRRGDNLTRIAQKFNTSIAELVRFNQLNGDRIFPGQQLRIPSEG